MAMAVLPASDIERAEQWWHDVFGLDPVRERHEGGDFYVIGGTAVLVYETQFAGTAQNTAFGLMTDDLDRDMTALRDARASSSTTTTCPASRPRTASSRSDERARRVVQRQRGQHHRASAQHSPSIAWTMAMRDARCLRARRTA